jgi:hypothetical protein
VLGGVVVDVHIQVTHIHISAVHHTFVFMVAIVVAVSQVSEVFPDVDVPAIDAVIQSVQRLPAVGHVRSHQEQGVEFDSDETALAAIRRVLRIQHDAVDMLARRVLFQRSTDGRCNIAIII